ncbi:MAG: hypothetical protein JKY29_02780, partial [Gammaproteobacteria bacterium]|nr:hypothetical protein [Gammaproteobacteria bacterium]
SENPAYSGDTGLFPDFLPNAIFAENFLTKLIGGEVTEAVLDAAVAEMTASLNAGDSRGATMNASINALAASTDPDFADAAAALANKTAVATYYSVDVAESSAELDDLIAVVSAVDSSATAVATGTTAVDTVIAGDEELTDLIANLDAANAAKTAELATLEATTAISGIDPTPLDKIPQADITALEGTAVGTTDAALVFADPTGFTAGDYTAGSDALQAALVADAAVAVAAKLKLDNTALALTLNTTAGTGNVAGLDGAIAGVSAALTTANNAIESAALAGVAATAALGDYNVLNASAVTLLATGATSGGEIIVSGTTLVLGAAITEATDPGITALLAASLANEGAQAVETGAIAAANTALHVVENLDSASGTRVADLAAVTAAMTFITPATATKATDAEIAAEIAALNAGNTQLKADLLAVTYNTDDATTLADVTTILAAAVTANFINAGDQTLILVAFGDDATADADFDPAGTAGLPAALAAASAAVTANSLAFDVDALNTVYLGSGTTLVGGETSAATLALAPLALAANVAAALVATTTKLGADVDAAIVSETVLSDAKAALAALDVTIAAETAAFAAAGFAAPVTLNSAVKAATVSDDVFLTGGIDSQIISFAGDDQLFIGSGLTLNADTTAGDEGDNAVLEVWITGTSSAVITIETSVFGSDAAVPETYTITLTGVAAADVALSADGIITIA